MPDRDAPIRRQTALAARLTDRRLQLGLSLRDMHRRAGLDLGTISLYERGQVLSPKLDTLVKFCMALDLPLEDLLQDYCAYVRQVISPSSRA